jgi:transcriptional regulator with XRE-family HTH domain
MSERLSKRLQENIGAGMRAARKAAGLTQEAAAARIGISVEFYARVERGNGLPSVDTLGKIVEQLDASAHGLLDVESLADLVPAIEDQGPPALRRLHRLLQAAKPEHLAKVNALLDLLETPDDGVENDEHGSEPPALVPVEGVVYSRKAKPGAVHKCEPCKGKGIILDKVCTACGGLGLVREELPQ